MRLGMGSNLVCSFFITTVTSFSFRSHSSNSTSVGEKTLEDVLFTYSYGAPNSRGFCNLWLSFPGVFLYIWWGCAFYLTIISDLMILFLNYIDWILIVKSSFELVKYFFNYDHITFVICLHFVVFTFYYQLFYY